MPFNTSSFEASCWMPSSSLRNHEDPRWINSSFLPIRSNPAPLPRFSLLSRKIYALPSHCMHALGGFFRKFCSLEALEYSFRGRRISAAQENLEDSFCFCRILGRSSAAVELEPFEVPWMNFLFFWKTLTSNCFGMEKSLNPASPDTNATLNIAPSAGILAPTVSQSEDATISNASADEQQPLLLQGKNDRYDGIIVDPSCLPSDPATFTQMIRASLAEWKSQCKKGVWLKLPLQHANLVLVATEEGFIYHHAEPTHVMMTYWIPETPSTLPSNASHQVGIGAFVINDQREILVVQEKTGPMRGTEVWKMPTGVINQGEDILAGAKREVKEETGVDAEFLEIVGVRQGHNAAFGKSDLFFLCLLRPTSFEIVSQDTEIAAAKWMPLEEFQAQPFYNESSMLKKMVDIAVASVGGHYKGFTPDLLQIGFRKLNSYFYYNMESLG